MGKIVFITGGARSGKSALALRLASGHGEKRAFVATMEPRDETGNSVMSLTCASTVITRLPASTSSSRSPGREITSRPWASNRPDPLATCSPENPKKVGS